MSRAFVKEDVELPTESVRRRSPSGLPPGAFNYLTEHGADYLHEEAAQLHRQGDDDSAKSIEELLATATVVSPPKPHPKSAVFGTKVTVQSRDKSTQTYGIVGVDEVSFHPNAVSWISPIGRALLGADLGQRVSLDGGDSKVTIVAIAPI